MILLRYIDKTSVRLFICRFSVPLFQPEGKHKQNEGPNCRLSVQILNNCIYSCRASLTRRGRLHETHCCSAWQYPYAQHSKILYPKKEHTHLVLYHLMNLQKASALVLAKETCTKYFENVSHSLLVLKNTNLLALVESSLELLATLQRLLHGWKQVWWR